jgi:hypothetical protein
VLVLMFSTFTIPFTTLLAALPAAGIITFAERRSIRSPMFYAAMGAVAAAATLLGIAVFVRIMQIVNTGPTASGGPPTDWIALVVAFAVGALLFGLPGVIGGLTYWAKAGRDAGCSAHRSGAGRTNTPTAPADLKAHIFQVEAYRPSF